MRERPVASAQRQSALLSDARTGAGARRPPRPLPRYLAGALAARIADEGARLSLVLLALDRSGSAAIGGAMVAGLLVPHVVAAPGVGMVIDRARRPRWAIALSVLIFSVCLFSVAQLFGRIPLWAIFVLLLAGGCCGPAITGGLTSKLPDLVGLDKAPRAFGLDSLFYNIAGMAGPAAVGLIAGAVGPVAAQSLLACSAGLGATCLATLPIPESPRRDPETSPNLRSGVKAILGQPTLRVVTLTSTLGQIGPGGLAVVAALLAASVRQPGLSGLLLTAVAAGSFVGSMLWTWHPIAPRRSALVSCVSLIGVGVPVALSALSQTPSVTLALFGLSGFFVGPYGSALFTARTQHAPEAARTQVFTIGAGLKVTASAVGAGLIGIVTGLPIAALLLVVAGCPILAGIVGTVLLSQAERRGRSRT